MVVSRFVISLRRRVIQNFMDIFILSEIKKGSMSGYDAIGFVHRKFGILMSSGTVYSLLYSLEREGWVRGVWNQRRRVYQLTEKGKEHISVITKANEETKSFLRNISTLSVARKASS